MFRSDLIIRITEGLIYVLISYYAIVICSNNRKKGKDKRTGNTTSSDSNTSGNPFPGDAPSTLWPSRQQPIEHKDTNTSNRTIPSSPSTSKKSGTMSIPKNDEIQSVQKIKPKTKSISYRDPLSQNTVQSKDQDTENLTFENQDDDINSHCL
ncbi:unnamed protein product [Caenorhabditis bovis]|uniref:Uncharacterized protein n=1 Tax=Caenorhabditis bovis TaxID=2654633 RepID=A0A8S1F6M9_9PELO|nr:unnamed protein product [Caenorhabditis bovis]